MAAEQSPVGSPSPPTPLAGGAGRIANKKRRGVVIVAVLVVVASLSLAGYHYNDMMVSEFKASENAHRTVQARANAEAGIHYAAALLSDPDSYTNVLGSNPWNNPQIFKGVLVTGEEAALKGRFSIIAPPNTGDSSNSAEVHFGVIDESSKINLNAMMRLDATGQQLHDMLVKLPNMTEEIANAIIDWMDFDSDPLAGGAENDHYSALVPPYRCKNGPIDSIDELLLVKGVTRELLYGADANRNGVQDPNEIAATGFDRGWSASLTVHSREQNSDPTGKPYIFLNNLDLAQLNTTLIEKGISDDMAKFIIMYRQYGPANAAGGAQSTFGTLGALLGGSKTTSSTSTSTGKIAEYKITPRMGRFTINSLFDLVGTQVSIKSVDQKSKKTKTTIYSSPLNDLTQLNDQLTKLFSATTPSEDPETPARINVNTAPREVLLTLPGLTENDVEKVIAARSSIDPDSEILLSPAWLLTEAQIFPTALRTLEKLITARTQVYRVQSVGYFDGKGPAVRLEAVIDTNSGRPRIIAWRDLSELGKGWSDVSP